jgi:hypothetical protein
VLDKVFERPVHCCPLALRQHTVHLRKLLLFALTDSGRDVWRQSSYTWPVPRSAALLCILVPTGWTSRRLCPACLATEGRPPGRLVMSARTRRPLREKPSLEMGRIDESSLLKRAIFAL